MPQNYENHIRFDPLTHFTLAPLAIILVALSIHLCIQQPNSLHFILASSGKDKARVMKARRCKDAGTVAVSNDNTLFCNNRIACQPQ